MDKHLLGFHEQGPAETKGTAAATVRMWEYMVMCDKLVDFTDHMVMEQFTVVQADEDTQRKLFTKLDVTLAEA